MTVPPGAVGRTPLDGPPPLPQQVPTAPGGGSGGYQGLGGATDDPQKEQLRGIAQAAQTVDQVLLTFSQALPQGSKEFDIARKAVEQGLAKGLAALGQAPEVTSTDAGSQFPGGGFSSVGAIGT